MKYYDIVGYTYDADVHCVSCAKKAFTQEDLDSLTDRHIAEWGGTLDSDPFPVFAGDADVESYSCGDCYEKLV